MLFFVLVHYKVTNRNVISKEPCRPLSITIAATNDSTNRHYYNHSELTELNDSQSVKHSTIKLCSLMIGSSWTRTNISPPTMTVYSTS